MNIHQPLLPLKSADAIHKEVNDFINTIFIKSALMKLLVFYNLKEIVVCFVTEVHLLSAEVYEVLSC